jgi:hypothetical protein
MIIDVYGYRDDGKVMRMIMMMMVMIMMMTTMTITMTTTIMLSMMMMMMMITEKLNVSYLCFSMSNKNSGQKVGRLDRNMP